MKVAILASGRGTDFQAIADHVSLDILQNVTIVCMITNHKDAPVIKRAAIENIPHIFVQGVSGVHYPDPGSKELARSQFDDRCALEIKNLDADLVVLAGFDQVMSPNFVKAFKFKILNIHPAYDAKRFGGRSMVGLKVHESVLSAGEKYSGCAIHYVTNEVDGGPIVLKKRVNISAFETAQSLEKKVLELEHLAYPEAIQLVADNRVRINENGKQCFIDEFSDGWDIEWYKRQTRYIERTNMEATL